MTTTKIKNRKNKYKVCYFNVGGGKATLSLPLGYENKVQLSYGKYYTVPPHFSARWSSKMQKQMRQYLYNRLTEMGLGDYYVLIMDFAISPVVGKQSFCDFAVTFPNRFGECYEMNEAFCRELIESFEKCLIKKEL